MTDIAKLKEETKNQLLALLLTVPKGLTINQLQNDFRSMIGNPLPFREMGYTSAQEFFTDIPDVCRVTWTRDDQLFLRGVVNDKTGRMHSLISKNKPSRPRSKRSRGGRPSTYRDRHPPPDPIVPTFVRAQIRELLYSYPNGLNASSFRDAFSRKFGNHLSPQKLGFVSIGDMLRAIPDVVQIEEMRGGGVRLYPKKGRFTSTSSSSNRERLADKHDKGKARDQRQRSSPQEKPRPVHVASERQSPDKTGITERPDNTRSREPSGDKSSVEDFEDEDETGISAELRKQIQEVLGQRPSGIWAARFPFEFKRLAGNDLPIKELGYLSVIEMMSTLPDVVTIERPSSKGDWMLYDARTRKPIPEPTKTEVAADEKVHLSTAPALDEIFKERIRQVLLTQPGGVSLRDFQQLYKTLCGEALPIKSLGFASLDALVISLVDVVLHMKYEGDGMVKLFSKDLSTPKTNLLVNRPLNAKRKGIPPDAVGPGVGFVLLEPPTDAEYLEVLVSNVMSPGKFWFQLKGEHTTVALEELMDRLEEIYYGSEGDSYQLPDSLIMIGQVCAAIFPEDENWHRATVTGIPNMDFVEVYFVDYGNTCSVARGSLRMLKSRFLKLPTQALRGRLSHICPPDGKQWSRKAQNRMLSLCANRPLVALVTGTKDRVMSLCLCDTTTEQDIHINDLLAEEGYAKIHTDDNQPLSPAAEPIPAAYTAAPPLATVSPITQQQTQKQPSNHSEHEDDEAVNVDVELRRRYIRSIQLTEDYNIHIINYEGKPFVVSGDISAFMWKNDVLRSMLRQVKLPVAKLVLAQSEHPDLFVEIQNYELKGTMEDGCVRSHITLYQLESVIDILQTFEHPSSALENAIMEQINCFNPEDGYWKGEDYSASDEGDGSDEMSDEDLGLDNLQITLQALQFRRKRILKQMMVECSEESVEELHEVELKIQDMRSRVKAAEAREAVKGQDSGTGHPEVTEEEEFIQECVMQQYQQDKPVSSSKPHHVSSSVNSPLKATNRVAPMVNEPVATTTAGSSMSTSTLTGAESLPTTTTAVPSGDAFSNLLNQTAAMSLEQQQLLYQNLLMNQACLPQMPLLPLGTQMLSLQQQQQSLLNPMMGLGGLALSGAQPALGFPLMGRGLGLQNTEQLGVTSALGQGRGLLRSSTEPQVGRFKPPATQQK